MKTCKVVGCNKKHFGKGYCQRHAWQFRTHGKILTNTRIDKNQSRTEGNKSFIVLRNKTGEQVAEAIVDAVRIEECLNHRWSLQNHGYVVARIYGKLILLHRFLHGIPPQGLDTDHINRNKLDNRASNIRHITRAQNMYNKAGYGASGAKGVYWDICKNKWMAAIGINGKFNFLGYFDDKRAAEKVRLQKENELMS